MFATDTLAILRDTQKEDKEKAIKKSWEDKEPGRAEKAKKTRTKYFAFEKKERGENLTGNKKLWLILNLLTILLRG